jgi:hypothetical protein
MPGLRPLVTLVVLGASMPGTALARDALVTHVAALDR